MKHFYILPFLLSGASSVQAQPQPTAPVQSPAPAEKVGLTITPINVETSDTDAMLNITFWHFHVKKTARKTLDWRVELREGSKAPVLMNAGHTSHSDEEDLALGIMLDEGKGIQSSSKVKIYMGSRYMENGTRTSGGYASPTWEDNAAFGLKTSSVSIYTTPTPREDGTILLMEFQATGRKVTVGEESPIGEKKAPADKTDTPAKCEVVLVIKDSEF